MFKESLICIILAVLIYQIYEKYFNKEQKKKIPLDEIENSLDNKGIQKIPESKPMVYETPNSFIHPQLGKPDKIIEEGYLFIINEPNPWNAIIFNQSKKENYMFVLLIKTNLDKLKSYSSKINDWLKIIPELRLNFQTGELIIPSEDEDIALALANLILSNIKGDLTLKNIIENNLIPISISKIKSHQSIRIKITEQILENVNDQNLKLNENDKFNYTEDLAETNESPIKPEIAETETPQPKQVSEIAAYEGGEFSFLS